MIKKFKSKLLIFLEKLLLKIPITPSLPIVFITGVPRSGTTITYQYFIELGDFCFFTNAERKSHKFPVISTLLHRSVTKYKPIHENSYGNIPGRFSPSDGWEIFHRWFPYYYDPDSPMKDNYTELYRTVAWFQLIYKKPFIVKNNANSLRIRELKKIFPNAIFIHVDRERQEVIESIAEGMAKNNIKRNGLWGTGPRIDLIPSGVTTYHDKATFQYHFIQTYVNSLPYVNRLTFDKMKIDQLKNNISSYINEIEKQCSATLPKARK
jgi:hypothetical protein